MVSTIACVAVKQEKSRPTEIAVVYDSGYDIYSDPDAFTLQDHHELHAVDYDASQFLGSLNLPCRQVYKQSFLKHACWECNEKKCLITIAFLAWRSCLKHKKGVTLNHGYACPDLKSPRTQELFVAIAFDGDNHPIDGCVVADNGHIDGPPENWLTQVKESNTVLTAIGQKTGAWLRKQVSYPIKVTHDIQLNFPCRECGRRTCPLVKAFYGWKRQAVQTSFIHH